MDLKEQYDKLLRYCYMKTRDRYLAEDIVQETFLRFWQSRTYKETGKQMAYLYTIARNLCMDEFRRPRTEDISEYEDRISDMKAGPERLVENLDLEQALERLPEEIREIVVLRHTSGLSAEEIGKMMGLSRFAVNRRAKAGLALLQKHLKEGGCQDDR